MNKISELQKIMYLNWRKNNCSGIDIEQWVFTLREVDLEKFRNSWVLALQSTSEANRSFNSVEQDIVYTNRQDGDSDITIHFDVQQTNLNLYLKEDRKTPFDLHSPPLMRFCLIENPDMTITFVWTFHHILLDGRSALELLNRVNFAYRGVDFVRKSSSVEILKQETCQDEFWSDLFNKDDYGSLSHVTSFNSESENRQVVRHNFILPKDKWSILHNSIKKAGITENSYIQVLWGIFLYWLTGKKNNIFATVRSGRFKHGLDQRDEIGCYIETVPFTINLEDQESIHTIISNTVDLQKRLRPYEGDGILKISSKIKKFNLQEKLFSLLNFDNREFQDVIQSFGGIFQDSGLNVLEDSGFPLTLSCRSGKFLNFSFVGDERFFSVSQMKIFGNLITSMCTEMIDDLESSPNMLIEKIVSLYKDDLIFQSKTHERFSFVHPIEKFCKISNGNKKIALSDKDDKITYEDLLYKVQKYANALLTFSSKKTECKIGIFLPRNISLISGILSTSYIGATFIPLDPDFPQERLQMIAEDSHLDFILTNKELESKAAGMCDSILLVEDLNNSEDILLDPVPVQERDSAYILYTSGSTGRPKGVVITWFGLSNLLQAMRISPGMGKEDVILSHTTVSFDPSILEIFLPLTSGSTIVLAESSDAKNPEKMIELIREKEISFLNATPSMYQLLLHSGWEGRKNLKALCGGEVLSSELASELLPIVGSLWNGYGPTEATVCSSVEKIENPLKISIGFPQPGLTYALVGPHGFPVPYGIQGELCISGVQLAKEYFDNNDLTEKAFLNMKLGDQFFRTYRTGDLVRFNEDRFEFLGRLDTQVKLRGYRIELGEIESILKTEAGLIDPVVLLQDEERPFLVAFHKSPEKSVNFQMIQEMVKDRLPGYMIPKYYSALDAYPMTPSGKTDRKNFPKISTTKGEVLLNQNGDEQDLRQEIAVIWADVLNMIKISPELHFFNSGGNSVDAVYMVNEVAKRLKIPVSVVTIYQAPMFKDFTDYIFRKEVQSTEHCLSQIDRVKARQKRIERNRNLRRG
ncbi:MAG: amino acid adenylation domain-containing protein [Spirochaetaceae bacterium]|nr:amino acid adenylation domain-containing protein [Spirochaetaceae bacterium]